MNIKCKTVDTNSNRTFGGVTNNQSSSILSAAHEIFFENYKGAIQTVLRDSSISTTFNQRSIAVFDIAVMNPLNYLNIIVQLLHCMVEGISAFIGDSSEWFSSNWMRNGIEMLNIVNMKESSASPFYATSFLQLLFDSKSSKSKTAFGNYLDSNRIAYEFDIHKLSSISTKDWINHISYGHDLVLYVYNEIKTILTGENNEEYRILYNNICLLELNKLKESKLFRILCQAIR